jgi:hypothetical protein
MRLRCADGVVRRFSISRATEHVTFHSFEEAECEECGHSFGVHDTAVLRPMFKAHVCKARPETTSHVPQA